ncbi:MAG: DEAD/DEAH box helicase family protein [Verrucomicrobiota bacterium]|nr:DEAD/DEAH box helicase family protein [Verrucomicrobiota bacterium]
MTNDEIKEFFQETQVNIRGNQLLREPQRESYEAIADHVSQSREASYIQLPVGCGKTGVMGLAPFGVAEGRVLILAPNITVRDTILTELDISKPDCFYTKRGVFIPKSGPYRSVLKPGANIHDCDNAHIVVANIQQFVGDNNKWYEQFPPDYFRFVLVDEGHHNVAESWRRLFEYFSDAAVVSFTATPVRSDGQQIEGRKIYSYTYTRAMLMGFISPIEAVYVAPAEVSFTAKGETKTISLAEVMEMRENDWFSKGIALSEECNRHIVQASVRQLAEVKRHGTPRQIIAAACSIRHANQVLALYHEQGLKAEVLHSRLSAEDRERIEAMLRQGLIDVVVQVQMLGEGYDLGTLSVAVVFRPYRSLSPFIQFVGRILRLANPAVGGSVANKVYVVSHVGMNDERWWTDFRNFDKEDQALFADILEGTERTIEGSDSTPRLTLRPFMQVLTETVDTYLLKGYLGEIDDAMVTEFVDTIRSKGFDPIEFGLTEDMVRTRLQFSALHREEAVPFAGPIQPQRRKEALRMRIAQEARSIADVVINRLGLKHEGHDLVRLYPGRGTSNATILIALAQKAQNELMGIASGEREAASIEQFETALEASAEMADKLTASTRAKLRG